MKKVQILMSTYNGEKYLQEQLDSIINQSYRPISLLIRDDGSTDSTVKILKQYTEKYSFIQLICDKNIGVVASFFELIKMADLQCDYFSFADQDDVWFSDKISHAVNMLDECGDHETPSVYFAKRTVVDENLDFIRYTDDPYFIALNNAIVQNIITGCTMVLNRSILALCRKHIPDTKHVYMHDWWIYLLVTSFGKGIYDERPCMYYRLHERNTLGAPKNWLERKMHQIHYLIDEKSRSLRVSQVREFYNIFGESLFEEDKILVEMFLHCLGNVYMRIRVGNKMPFLLQREKPLFRHKVLFILGIM